MKFLSKEAKNSSSAATILESAWESGRVFVFLSAYSFSGFQWKLHPMRLVAAITEQNGETRKGRLWICWSSWLCCNLWQMPCKWNTTTITNRLLLFSWSYNIYYNCGKIFRKCFGIFRDFWRPHIKKWFWEFLVKDLGHLSRHLYLSLGSWPIIVLFRWSKQTWNRSHKAINVIPLLAIYRNLKYHCLVEQSYFRNLSLIISIVTPKVKLTDTELCQMSTFRSETVQLQLRPLHESV